MKKILVKTTCCNSNVVVFDGEILNDALGQYISNCPHCNCSCDVQIIDEYEENNLQVK